MLFIPQIRFFTLPNCNQLKIFKCERLDHVIFGTLRNYSRTYIHKLRFERLINILSYDSDQTYCTKAVVYSISILFICVWATYCIAWRTDRKNDVKGMPVQSLKSISKNKCFSETWEKNQMVGIIGRQTQNIWAIWRVDARKSYIHEDFEHMSATIRYNDNPHESIRNIPNWTIFIDHEHLFRSSYNVALER